MSASWGRSDGKSERVAARGLLGLASTESRVCVAVAVCAMGWGGIITCADVSRTLSIDLSTCVLAMALPSMPPSRDLGLAVASFDLGLLAISAAWKWSR